MYPEVVIGPIVQPIDANTLFSTEQETKGHSMTGMFDASAAAAGYAMQMRYGLLVSLRLLRSNIDWSISLEAGDDIEIELAEHQATYMQIKHRQESTNLTDSSSDLWKSLRVWSEAVSSGECELSKTSFALVTTSTAAGGSIAELLSPEPSNGRDPEIAYERLNAVAEKSESKTNAKAIEAWKVLNTEQRSQLLRRTVIIASSSDIEGTRDSIEAELRLSVRRSHLQAFIRGLEGWWFQRCINIFRSKRADFVTGAEVESVLADLRESFLPENLPIDSDILDSTAELEIFDDRRFVKQAEFIGVGHTRIGSAVRDYLRAYTQRSRWVRDSLLLPNEIGSYEARLVEEWQYLFNRLEDDLPSESSDAMRKEMAKQIYAWVESATAPPIRDRCTERFVIRGSLHILADRESSGVVWHPDFEARLMALLEPIES